MEQKKQQSLINSVILIALIVIMIVTAYISISKIINNKKSKENILLTVLDPITGQSLIETLDANKDIIIYFQRPDCPDCIRAYPKLIAAASKYDIKMKSFHTREEIHAPYEINEVPTIIHFVKGLERRRIEGDRSEDEYNAFFKDVYHTIE